MKGKKKLIAVIAAVLALLMITGTVIGVVLMHHEDENNEGSPNNVKDELFVMELFHMNIEDVLNDPEWEEDLVSATENYVMVYSDKFDFAQQIGMSDGYSYLYFDESSRDINMIVHNFIAYTNDKDSKAEIESVVSNIEGGITGLLGSASQPFMLMNTSGEFEDYSNLTLDQMIEKVIEGNTVMYNDWTIRYFVTVHTVGLCSSKKFLGMVYMLYISWRMYSFFWVFFDCNCIVYFWT